MRRPAAMIERAGLALLAFLSSGVPIAGLLALAALTLLTGCGSVPPKVETVTVTVTELVGIPPKLTGDCYDEAPREQTQGEAKRLANLRHDALAECTGRMREIRRLSEEAERARKRAPLP